MSFQEMHIMPFFGHVHPVFQQKYDGHTFHAVALPASENKFTAHGIGETVKDLHHSRPTVQRKYIFRILESRIHRLS